VGDGVRLGVEVIVGDSVSVAVYAGVGVPVALAVALGLGDGVALGEAVCVGEADGMRVTVGEGIGVGRRAKAQPPPKPTAARRTPSGTRTNQLLRMRPILNSTRLERKEYFGLPHESSAAARRRVASLSNLDPAHDRIR
jgi:hypothetical protein